MLYYHTWSCRVEPGEGLAQALEKALRALDAARFPNCPVRFYLENFAAITGHLEATWRREIEQALGPPPTSLAPPGLPL